jgi:hypothetical protein
LGPIFPFIRENRKGPIFWALFASVSIRRREREGRGRGRGGKKENKQREINNNNKKLKTTNDTIYKHKKMA